MAKVTVTLKVEFEADTPALADVVLGRGIAQLKESIERGSPGFGTTGVKPGSVKVTKIEQ